MGQLRNALLPDKSFPLTRLARSRIRTVNVRFS
jgi:hypothetical protein